MIEEHALRPGTEPVALAELMFPSTVRCVSVAAQYGIAEFLVDGPMAVDRLAARSGTDPASLRKVLRRLSDEGVFAETEPGVFANTALSNLLRPGVPGSLHAMARMVGEPWLWSCWGRLDHSVATGDPAFDETHGTTLWAWLAQNPGSARLFNDAMTDFSEALSRPVVQAHPEFGDARVVADLGGGQGTFLATLLTCYPAIERGILVDLPAVVDEARRRPDLTSLSDQGRLEFAGGDFFASVPEGVDTYVTKQIMHSWDDGSLVRLLRMCRQASPGARIVAAEMVDDDGVSSFVKDFNLTMLVTMSGNIRGASAFERLYAQAGYRLSRIVSTGTAFSLVEGVPAGT